MKYKIWIWAITAVISIVIIKYYLVDYAESGQSAAKNLDTNKEKMTEHEKETENSESEAAEADTIEETDNIINDTMIRVLIKNDNFEGVFHEHPCISCNGSFQVKTENNHEVFLEGEIYQMEGEELAIVAPLEEEGLIICDLERNQEQPVFEGSLELNATKKGIVIINQLPLEKYLPKVLSSEMSSAFPMEALKAQAICARTYAMKKIEENENAYYGADLDDSVSYQVYNNMEDSPETRKAVEETRGMVLLDSSEDNGLAEVYYYSTSCGVTSEDSFKTEGEFRNFIISVRSSDMEKNECWYRWRTDITLEQIGENLIEMGYQGLDVPETIDVVQRKPNGQAEQLKIDFSGGKTEIIEGEYNIRKALAPVDGSLILQDGSICDGLEMLPSGWFVMEWEENAEQTMEDATEQTTEQTAGETNSDERAGGGGKLRILGGGYGHGNGLAQNGARLMAEQGMDYQQILNFYYPGQSVGMIQ